VNRGELYRVHNPTGDPKKNRTFVIVSRQALSNTSFSTLICAPVFSDAEGLSTQVPIDVPEGMKHHSWIYCDNLVSVPKSALTQYVGSLSPAKIAELDRALRIALDLAV
jgi:mRNA interferase MazF